MITAKNLSTLNRRPLKQRTQIKYIGIRNPWWSPSVEYRSDAKVSDRYLIDVDPWVFAIWDNLPKLWTNDNPIYRRDMKSHTLLWSTLYTSCTERNHAATPAGNGSAHYIFIHHSFGYKILCPHRSRPSASWPHPGSKKLRVTVDNEYVRGRHHDRPGYMLHWRGGRVTLVARSQAYS